MQKERAFNPMGPEYLIPADTTAPTGVQVSVSGKFTSSSAGCYRIVNSGTTAVNLAYAPTGAAAKAKAVLPTAGTPQESITLASGAVEVFSIPKDMFFSGLSTAAANVYITPGEGI